jgi:hypothetical protein
MRISDEPVWNIIRLVRLTEQDGRGCGLRESFSRAAERWRDLHFTDFELRQIAAVRNDLDAEYDANPCLDPAS